MYGEAVKIVELLQRDDTAAFIDRAGGEVRHMTLRASGNGYEAQGGRVCGHVAGCLSPGTGRVTGLLGAPGAPQWACGQRGCWLCRCCAAAV